MEECNKYVECIMLIENEPWDMHHSKWVMTNYFFKLEMEIVCSFWGHP